MISTNATTDQQLLEWENICLDFFINGTKTAGAVIGLVEFAARVDGRVVVAWEGLDASVRKEDVEPLLERIGFVDGALADLERQQQYIAAKSRVRSHYHRQKARELRQELERLLYCKPAVYTTPHRRSELVTFVALYKGSVGAQSFVKGLKRLLELQLHQTTLASWVFLDDTLIQNGPDFMRASVNLLVNVLGFTHAVQEADKTGDQEGERIWYMSVALSDSEISSLLAAFPKESALGGVRPTGTVKLSELTRPAEMVGSSRGVAGWLCYLPIRMCLLWWSVIRLWFNFWLGIFGLRRRSPTTQNVQV